MWKETKDGLYKHFEFKDFVEAFDFMKRVGELAEKYNHHPKWTNVYGTVDIWLSTHEEGDSITKKDKELAIQIDRLNGEMEINDDKKTTSKTTEVSVIKLYTDGGSRGNPGPSASGYVLYDEADQELEKDGLFLGVTTNNQAEYRALKLGLESAQKYSPKTVRVFMDSLLIVNQMTGHYKIKNKDLLPVYQSVKDLTAQFEDVTFTHVPRELNKVADGEVNRVLDEQTS